jgi:hypothetical protein
MSERFDWPQTSASFARLKAAWADLQQALRESRAERRKLKATTLILKAIDIDRIEAAALCCVIADAVRAKLDERAA